MRVLSISFLLTILFLTTGLYGCKEGCDDVQCGPAPPLLMVKVRDTVTVKHTVAVRDTVTGDTTMVEKDTTLIRPTVEATVTLHTVDSASGMLGNSFGTAVPVPSDTAFTYTERSTIPSGTFALVASRGSRADTLFGLTLKRVEGCCGYDVVGSYTVILPIQ